ncbi:hypothetical protein PAXRUDRAFT_13478 [Paxillus rubicundulus Ve08.2h10]|uniref:Uncharacterized protein n=1 Tax=Paxillus rubicundulus Ve08.2h10 TaxID=930991 RepID=A0A0D0DYZ9_9AGAM|nr:hypothetical protein PAXRUDRAFT_13478 [Paxillus rubicundulus Ve08.2h10]
MPGLIGYTDETTLGCFHFLVYRGKTKWAHRSGTKLSPLDNGLVDEPKRFKPPDALKAFEMNKSDSGKQWKQHDTLIPQSNPDETRRGLTQRMTTASCMLKGLISVLEERGFDLTGLKTECAPVCPFESTGRCMAQLLSQQDDFIKQVSMLEKFINEAGHLCIFSDTFPRRLRDLRRFPNDALEAAYTALTSSYGGFGSVAPRVHSA